MLHCVLCRKLITETCSTDAETAQTDYTKPSAGEELYKCNMNKVMINTKENLRGRVQYLCTRIK